MSGKNKKGKNGKKKKEKDSDCPFCPDKKAKGKHAHPEDSKTELEFRYQPAQQHHASISTNAQPVSTSTMANTLAGKSMLDNWMQKYGLLAPVFQASKAKIVQVKSLLSPQNALALYGLDQQVMSGDCTSTTEDVERLPDLVSKGKVIAWSACRGMDQLVAMEAYIDLVETILLHNPV